MDKLNQLTHYLNRVALDVRLKPTHIAVYFALCNQWIACNCQDRFSVTRRQLMRTAHIKSIATYHKVINQLQRFGYLHYAPSYHPQQGSSVSLIRDNGPCSEC
jgi:hypothetical protein